MNSLQHHLRLSIVASDNSSTRGLPTATTRLLERVIAVLNSAGLQKLFKGSNGRPVGSKLSTVLIKSIRYSCPVCTCIIIKCQMKHKNVLPCI